MPHAFRAAALVAALWTTATVSAQEFEGERLLSPSGDIEVSVAARGGRLGYAVHYRGEEVVRPSQLGLLFESRHGFNDGMVLTGEPERHSSDTTWEQPWGENRFVRDHYNELLVTARHEVSGAVIDIRIRAFDDGIGFRYEMPEQPGIDSLNIVMELTQFSVPPEATAWWIPADRTNRYEILYRESGLEEIDRVHTPVTFRLPSGMHLSIHEAALVDYSGMTLLREDTGRFRAALRPWSDGVLVKTAVPFVSPWRTIQIAPDAVGLVNSSLILNLNEPNKLGDVSWVKPGKYVGIWWAMHINERTWGRDGVHGATTEETMRYMDFAAENGFVGVLVEGWNVGWDGDWQAAGDLFSFTESYPDFDIEAVTRYGHERGVELIGHHETSGNITNYERQLGAAFDLYEELGVTRVKTGYVAGTSWLKWVDENGVPHYEYHDGQFAVRHHLKVIEEAARRGISINPHEPVKDTGLRRTYPNWVTREGARGQEYNAWGMPPNPPEHTTILPFTRMLSGPMDFTPGIFDLMPNERPPVREDMLRGSPESRVETTLAKQLALFVILHSPLQMAADLPENYEARPDAFKFIRDVPADWGQTVALTGEVGDYVVIARRERGAGDWYVGAITDEEPRQVEVDLSFLDRDGRYNAEIYVDGADAHWESNPYSLSIEERPVTVADRLALQLAAGGGAAIRLAPIAD
ncbi:MAG: glycoside hydrolase family 97 protein [Proteobacteria bacterium]|nr:glycoside hydrolase family 97 protein [Pseudomonadota bacterium]MYJ95510.1 glycoside hydrolase family 97 protein [Pseudomonadota bacterium]